MLFQGALGHGLNSCFGHLFGGANLMHFDDLFQ